MRETWHQITFVDIFPVLGAGATVMAGVQAINFSPLVLRLSLYLPLYIDVSSEKDSGIHCLEDRLHTGRYLAVSGNDEERGI